MHASKLTVVTARFNPLRWEVPERHYRDWVTHMLDSGVTLVVVECQYGERDFACDLHPHIKHLKHIGVRAQSPAWTKENLINIGIQRTPEAEYIAWIDSDVFFEKHCWASETLHALQLYRWIQPWSQALDRGPNGEIMNGGMAFRSFCQQYELGCPLTPDKHGWHVGYGHPYPHPGFAWATTRRVLEYTGGLFELGGMGASDHAMALALVGMADKSVPADANPRYVEHLMRWQERVQTAVHGRIGYVHNVINHRFHGDKRNRNYRGRWEMFLEHGFNPDVDLKRNSYGVLEFSGTNPELEREWMNYLRSRNEDCNCSN